MVNKVVGYAVSVAGIVVMAVGFDMIRINWEILNLIGLDYIAGIGLALVGAGVLISLKGKKGRKRKGGEDEIPIYEGLGKRRRIVGYRKG